MTARKHVWPKAPPRRERFICEQRCLVCFAHRRWSVSAERWFYTHGVEGREIGMKHPAPCGEP